MSAPKITPTQQRFLDALGEGAELSYLMGRVRVHFPGEPRRGFEVPSATVYRLRDLGLVIADAQGVRLAG